MSNILSQILASTYTSSRLTKRLRLLREYLNQSFFSKKYDFSSQSYVDKEDLEWIKNLDEQFLKQFKAESLDQTLDSLLEEAKKLPVLVIYIPVDFPDEEINRISQNVRQNLNKTILIDFKLDPTLLAGCAFVWNGVYKDYSLRKKIDANRESILAQLKGFMKSY